MAAGGRQMQRWASRDAIYGVISITLVIVAWESEGGYRWDLAELILGYIILLWLTHTYADYAAHGVEGSWWEALRHELPVAVAGVPALVVAFLAAAADTNDDTASGLALAACGLTLVAIQIAILRPAGASRGQIIRTVVFDLVAAAFVVFLHIVVE